MMAALTDASLPTKVSAEGRTLGDLAWHAVLTLGEMAAKTGVRVEAPGEDTPEPAHAADIAAAYGTASQSLADDLQARWKDSMLPEKFEMYGSTWTREAALASVVRHEIHHRGQMTVLMRQAGLKVPGVYGPAREEWASMGMKPAK
jgi:uncharacterized damage-inducible protein DinB